MEFAWSAIHVPLLLANVLSIGLAVALVAYDPRGKHSLLFAAFLVARALGGIGLQLGSLSLTEGTAVLFHRVSWYFLIAQVPILAIFMMHYPRRRPWVRPWMHWAVAAPFALALLIYSIHVDWWGTLAFTDRLVARRDGWLSWLVVLVRIAPLVAAIVFFLDLRRTAPGPRREVLRLLTIGFWWYATYNTGIFLLLLAAQGVPASGAGNAAWVDFGLNVTQTIGFVVAVAVAVSTAMRDPESRSLGIRYASSASAFAGVAFFAAGWWNGLWGLTPNPWLNRIGLAVTYAALPALVTYALLKCRLFDIDVRVKFVLGQSTFASMVGFLFWLVTSLISEAIEPDGIWPSVVAGALVAVAFKPIHMLAMRFADKVMPNAKRLSDMDPDERQQLYEEQVQLAWTDRVIGEKERRILENLRDRLDLSQQQASSIEGRILGGT